MISDWVAEAEAQLERVEAAIAAARAACDAAEDAVLSVRAAVGEWRQIEADR